MLVVGVGGREHDSPVPAQVMDAVVVEGIVRVVLADVEEQLVCLLEAWYVEFAKELNLADLPGVVVVEDEDHVGDKVNKLLPGEGAGTTGGLIVAVAVLGHYALCVCLPWNLD